MSLQNEHVPYANPPQKHKQLSHQRAAHQGISK